MAFIADWLKRRKSRRNQKILADAMREATQECVEQTVKKWVYFNDLLKFKDDVPLADLFISFASPVMQGIYKTYPYLRSDDDRLAWLIIFRAIQLSGTHSQTDINKAVRDLGFGADGAPMPASEGGPQYGPP